MMAETGSLRWISMVGAAVAFVGVSIASPALGQEVNRYGPQSDDSQSDEGGQSEGSRMVYPGQPMPQTNEGSDAQQGQQTVRRQEGEQEDSESQSSESYEIRVHDPSEQMEGDRRQKTAPLKKSADKMYQGVIPGKRDSVEHLKEKQSGERSTTGLNELTWIGFQPEDQRTRIFVQTAREPDYSVRREEDGRRVVVTFDRTEVSTKNFRRHIDASYFDRVVERIETSVVDDETVELRIKLASESTFSVEAAKNYLHIDFPHESAGDDDSSDSEE